ncbi:CehA/McbA family metallohydrolase [Engelhardtia mirabilis]|uniref:Polymerase/histidinol phosphatase N-terminal domain-containing protein n=1 Tax=Engelhardtia mirabilis TaxID=2528011 RepID=A0A518BN16_9BACT|nr:hypothetical protein Pla133_34640 [Planctomycetes bacterium Pla133]QDV02694.1 hypothetical protein Pla86_34630 [Planctomycetes bacterium Pla86]
MKQAPRLAALAAIFVATATPGHATQHKHRFADVYETGGFRVAGRALEGTAPFERVERRRVDAGAPALLVFAPRTVRELVRMDAQALLYEWLPQGERAWLEELRVVADGHVIDARELSGAMVGDPRFGHVNADLERLPETLSHLHRHGRQFASPLAPTLEGDAALLMAESIGERVNDLVADLRATPDQPYGRVDFSLDLDQIFAGTDPAGSLRPVTIEVDYRLSDGRLATAWRTFELRWLGERPGVGSGPLPIAGANFEVHRGDLHVHSCHGEAVGACAPSSNCAAETLQVSGSFSFAQLKTQYQALGVDFFTSTDHSYCIDDNAEFAVIEGELAAITDAGFIAIMDTELSSDEVGPQTGSNSGDLTCLGLSQHNHMGAHGIDTRKAGGGSGLLGWCDGLFSDALDSFTNNIAKVRAEGGYPVVNHGTADFFGWQSFQATTGIEAGGMHGCEIWNGEFVSGQGGDVGQWVDWLLGGRILYGYGGSDTHDAAFDFGVNHVLVPPGGFSTAGLEAALKAGRVFVSNDATLILEARLGTLELPMGTLQSFDPGTVAPNQVTLEVTYDFGAKPSQITIFTGRVGDADETVACQSATLSGAGSFECTVPLELGARSWFRAYSQSSAGTEAAYTNPVFFLPSSCAWAPYGLALGGANVGSLSSATGPSVGSIQRLEFAGLGTSPAAVVAGGLPLAAPGLPFAGGSLLLQLPAPILTTAPMAGGAGVFDVELPLIPALVGATLAWQAAAVDGTQPGGLAFTNGISASLCAVGG